MRLIKIIFACGLLAIMAVSLKAQPSTTPAPAIQPAQGVSAPTAARRRRRRKQRQNAFHPGRAGAFHIWAIAGDQFNDLHVDCRGGYSGHRPRDDLEKHQGNSVGDAERDGSARRRLGRFDGRHSGSAGHALGFSVRDDVFHFHHHVQFRGFDSGRRQHRVGTPVRTVAAVCVTRSRFSARRRRMRT